MFSKCTLTSSIMIYSCLIISALKKMFHFEISIDSQKVTNTVRKIPFLSFLDGENLHSYSLISKAGNGHWCMVVNLTIDFSFHNFFTFINLLICAYMWFYLMYKFLWPPPYSIYKTIPSLPKNWPHHLFLFIPTTHFYFLATTYLFPSL